MEDTLLAEDVSDMAEASAFDDVSDALAVPSAGAVSDRLLDLCAEVISRSREV